MADDGLLVNFDLGSDAIIKPKTKITGGSWKDRRKALREAKGPPAWKKKDAFVAEGKGQAQDFNIANGPPDIAPGKGSNAPTSSIHGKRKRDGEREAIRKEFTQSKAFGTKPAQSGKDEKNSSKGPKEKQIVSSLFTYNPEPEKPAEKVVVDDSPKAPTNAPINDGSASFAKLGLTPILTNHLVTKLGLENPTAIQKTAIPQLVAEDSDAFIQAETGSGKTLTYLLPIMNRIMTLTNSSSDPSNTQLHRDSGLFAVIIAPTRELARQIMGVTSTLIHAKNGPHWIVPTCLTGGEKKKSEKARLRKGVNILIATPGRLLDHLETTKSLDASKVRWLVLDEGDRLMELGFEESIQKILSILNLRSELSKGKISLPTLPKRRITILCSATMKTNVQKLGEMSLKDALYIKADKEETSQKEGESEFHAPAQLKQNYAIIPQKLRLVSLYAVLKRAFIRRSATPKVIVFFSCSDSVDFHFDVFARQLKKEEEESSDVEDTKNKESKTPKVDSKGRENPAVSSSPLHPDLVIHKLHGSLAQPIRTATLNSFTKTKTPALLFCTDVAARGLDLPNLDLVIQYDPPFDSSDYLHRIGRTARAGREGRALLFLLPGAEEGYLKVIDKDGKLLVRTDLNEILRRGFGEKAEEAATEWQLDVERWVLEDSTAMEKAKKAWASHIRAYTTHKGEEKSIFNHRLLHYGHMAKSFGLRERPGDIKVPEGGSGSGGKKSTVDKVLAKQAKGGKKRALEDVDMKSGGDEEAKERMRKMARMMERSGLKSEFNIG